MTNNPTGIRFNELDKAALTELVRRLQMNKTAILRGLVHGALAILKEREANEHTRMVKDAPTRRT